MKKRCNKCWQTKDLTDFYRDRSKKDGRHTICKVCNGAQDFAERRCQYPKCQKWFKPWVGWQKFCCTACNYKNRNHISGKSGKQKERNARWRERNRERLAKEARKWYWENRDQALEKSKQRRLRRKARILNAFT